MSREQDLSDGLSRVRDRIERGCAEAGRDPGEVTLVVVTKFFPAGDVRLLADLGVGDVAENKHQEAVAKAEELADLGLRWHYVGGLQSNKAAAVGRYAHAVHSLDRAKLLSGLARGAAEQGRELDVLVQVSLDGPDGAGGGDGRAGVDPAEAVALAERAADTEGLRLRGVMAVAPREGDAGEAFARLAVTAAEVRRVVPTATWISAGMSGDLEQALAHGATHLRVGSAVLGPRPSNK